MPTFVALLNWTDQGIRGFKDTRQRGNDPVTSLVAVLLSVVGRLAYFLFPFRELPCTPDGDGKRETIGCAS